MGEGKWVVFVHRGAGSTIGCLVMALLRRPPVEGGRQTIFHVSVATGFPNGLLNAGTTHQARDAAVPESHPTQPRLKSSNRFKARLTSQFPTTQLATHNVSYSHSASRGRDMLRYG